MRERGGGEEGKVKSLKQKLRSFGYANQSTRFDVDHPKQIRSLGLKPKAICICSVIGLDMERDQQAAIKQRS